MSIAEQLEENEQFEQAYEEYKKDLSHNPKDLNILERLGHLAMVLDKKDEAEEYYTKILEHDLTNTMCYEQLMDIYIDTDKYKYYISRGNLHSVEKKLEHAINDYKKALNHTTVETEIVMTRFTLANMYSQINETTKAIDEILKILEYDSINEAVYIKLAQLYTQEDMATSAIDILERARKKFDNETINENLAKLYLKNNEPQKAKELTKDELLKIKCMLELKETDEALKSLDEIEDKYKNNAEFYTLKAQYYFVTKDYDKALENVDKHNELNYNSPVVFQMRALIYECKDDNYRSHLNWGKFNLVRGNKDVAINEFLNAYQYNNSDVSMMNTLATLLEESGDKNGSIEFWEKIADAEPTNKKALEKLADFRESIGDYMAQTDYLEKSYELDKRNAIIVKKLAQIYHKKIKNKPDAIKYYTRYTEIAPNAEDIQVIRKSLEELEHSNMETEEIGWADKIINFFSKK